MHLPMQEQPPHRSPLTEIYIESPTDSISPYGMPAVLGPIVPSTLGPRGVGPQPTFVTCHMCNQEIKTMIYHRSTVKTHLLAACLCIFGCWPCACLPYCMHTCTKTDHYCPYCSAFIGSYSID